MIQETLEVYSNASNYTIVRPSGRRFPGCVIQGDSLGILCRKIRRVARAAKVGVTLDQDTVDEIEELNNALIERLLHYQAVLKAHGIAFPHGKAFTEADLIPEKPDIE